MVVGDVARPGAVLVQAPVRAGDAIEAAGGVAPTGARRGILIRRGNDSLWVDLVRFERTGDFDANPLVFETDVIIVPTVIRRVEIGGAVAHPGWYDLAPGDRVTTLIAAAGGLLPQAARAHAERVRAVGLAEPERFALNLNAALGAPGGDADVALEPGDRLFVPAIAHWGESARAVVSGEVARPGPYPIADGVDRLSSLLERAGGYTEWADRSAVRIERASDAALRDSAFLRLAREQEGVLNEAERDYVIALTRERRALSVTVGRDDVSLLDGDRVVVPRRSLTVMVQGEVKFPGHVPFTDGRTVEDYVRAAGGYTSQANRGRVRVTLAATGRPVGASDTGKLRAGDIVWVPARAPRSAWGTIRDVLTTAAQVATVYLVVREATK
jgi:protein involved in polysaccharide export with SLBB domain